MNATVQHLPSIGSQKVYRNNRACAPQGIKITNPTMALSVMRHQEARDQGFTTVTYIIIIWHLGKKGALRTAIDSQENILTLLQEKRDSVKVT